MEQESARSTRRGRRRSPHGRRMIDTEHRTMWLARRPFSPLFYSPSRISVGGVVGADQKRERHGGPTKSGVRTAASRHGRPRRGRAARRASRPTIPPSRARPARPTECVRGRRPAGVVRGGCSGSLRQTAASPRGTCVGDDRAALGRFVELTPQVHSLDWNDAMRLSLNFVLSHW